MDFLVVSMVAHDKVEPTRHLADFAESGRPMVAAQTFEAPV